MANFKLCTLPSSQFGCVFEMPLVTIILAKMGIANPEIMKKGRGVAIVLIFLVAAIITPPDIVSQCMVAGPMVLLYFISIFLSGIFYKPRSEDGDDEEDAEEEPADEDTAQPEAAAPVDLSQQELAAYRRAEQAERNAMVRARKLREQLSLLCEQSKDRYTDAGEEISALTSDLSSGLSRLQETLADIQAIFDDAESAFDELQLPGEDDV